MKRKSNPYYSVDKNGVSFDPKNAKEIDLAIEQMRAKDHITSLEERSLQYLQYSDVTDLQKKYLNVNRRLVGDINDKLDILKKISID